MENLAVNLGTEAYVKMILGNADQFKDNQM